MLALGNGAVGLPWRCTGRGICTPTTRNSTGLGRLSKAYLGVGEGGWLCVGGGGDGVTGRHGGLWTQGLVTASWQDG